MFFIAACCFLLISLLITLPLPEHTALEVNLGPATKKSINAGGKKKKKKSVNPRGRTKVFLMTMYKRDYYRQGSTFLVQNFPRCFPSCCIESFLN